MSYYIEPRMNCGELVLHGMEPTAQWEISDSNGNIVELPVLKRQADSAVVLDAAELECWSPECPKLYTLSVGDEKIRFGYSELRTMGNHTVLLNGSPYYLRGYIRGIVGHEHPNMTGGPLLEACRKNIRQAKKYGFNLVRFHSTVPTEEFVQAADELGLLIHMEIGFVYEYDSNGQRIGLALNNANWSETILRYRNHPSVAIFCIGNEMHNAGRQPAVYKLYCEGKTLAPGKLIMDNSGWGEFDRTTADIYSQHIAYYYPYKKHRDMFREDFCWHINGSVSGAPMSADENGVKIRRHANPLRPVLAHEAVHYIDVPDYEALRRKMEEFCSKVDPEYLETNKIKIPHFLYEIPELIRRKGLAERMPDYIAASQNFKKLCLKTYLERLRLSGLCGFEMLQFADCLKYENKNGIVDCFDDDKNINANRMREFNSDSVLLADLPDVCMWENEELNIRIYLSHFAQPENITGTLVLKLDGTRIAEAEHVTTVSGLQELLAASFVPLAGKHLLEAEFTAPGVQLHNSWNFFTFPEITVPELPENTVRFSVLTDEVFEALAAGKTVLLDYHRDMPGNTYYWPGSLDRFKPCIWDRGNNLGGIIRPEWAKKALLSHYFEENMFDLVEGAYKLNLDTIPVLPDEFISGVDKPVRDRVKGLVQGIKNFIDADTLRNFCYLGAWRVGSGVLVVNTLNQSDRPGAKNLHTALISELSNLKPQAEIAPEVLKSYLQRTTADGVIKEDVMNRFWELDNKSVEDVLFWEECNIDLTKL